MYHLDEFHGHPHTHSQPSPKSPEEIRTLLNFMISHNSHHCEEMAELLDSLPEKARKRMMIALGSFEAANVDLQQVLEYLD